MGCWIDACKKEINSIINCVRSQHFNIQIRTSIVAYRDHCDGKDISEVLGFTSDIGVCKKFVERLRPLGGGDGPEDVAGGFEQGLNQDW